MNQRQVMRLPQVIAPRAITFRRLGEDQNGCVSKPIPLGLRSVGWLEVELAIGSRSVRLNGMATCKLSHAGSEVRLAKHTNVEGTPVHHAATR